MHKVLEYWWRKNKKKNKRNFFSYGNLLATKNIYFGNQVFPLPSNPLQIRKLTVTCAHSMYGFSNFKGGLHQFWYIYREREEYMKVFFCTKALKKEKSNVYLFIFLKKGKSNFSNLR